MYEMEEMGEPLLSSIHESYPNSKHENDEPYLTANTIKKWNGNIKYFNDPCQMAFNIGFLLSLILWNVFIKKNVYK